MSWEVIAVTAARILKYSTPFGHLWNFGTFMCRLLPASTIGEAVYGDEMSDFECLTTQPGCQQMCYNQFSPMTHTRFWSMHILILSFPPIMFAFIAANFNAKLKLVRSRTQDPSGMSTAGGNSSRNGSIKGSIHSSKEENPYYGSQRYYKDVQWLNKVKTKQRKNINPDEDEEVTEVFWAPTMRRWYVIHLFLKLLFEIFGLYAWYLIQLQQNPGKDFLSVWTVPDRYSCIYGQQHDNWACSQEKEVPCWVPRPWEKRIFLHYMLFIQLSSIVIILFDLIYVAQRVGTKKLRKRRERKKLLPADDQVSLFSEKNTIQE